MSSNKIILRLVLSYLLIFYVFSMAAAARDLGMTSFSNPNANEGKVELALPRDISGGSLKVVRPTGLCTKWCREDIMPPRREVVQDIHEEQGNPPPPPPPQDSVTRMLEGMAQLLERMQGAPRPQTDIYERFRRLDPKEFSGTTDPFHAEGWIRSLEMNFRFLNMGDADRVRCAAYLFRGDASLWWEGVVMGVNLNTLTWEQFKEVFYAKYFTVDVRGRLKREIMRLRQGDLSVADYIRSWPKCMPSFKKLLMHCIMRNWEESKHMLSWSEYFTK